MHVFSTFGRARRTPSRALYRGADSQVVRWVSANPNDLRMPLNEAHTGSGSRRRRGRASLGD
nr:hypothetical protein GCM10020063_043160 [Dactylosporangium thailandense]